MRCVARVGSVMRCFAHMVAVALNVPAALRLVGLAMDAPTGMAGLVCGLMAALCVFNAYAHFRLSVTE